MDDLNGWQRLWLLAKWLTAIGVGLIAANAMAETLPSVQSGNRPSPGQILIGLGLGGVIAGGIAFSMLHALEWVYRGFRPLVATPMEAVHTLVSEDSDRGKELPLALPHQTNQQRHPDSSAPSQEPQQREYYP